jgi:IS5 family transposase
MSQRKGQFGFFDLEKQLDKIYHINDFLPKLNSLIDWEMFRPTLNKVREKEQSKEQSKEQDNTPANKGGRPPFDVVLMFKVLVIKEMYNLSDAQTELQIRDRISFRAFLHLNFCDTVPDEKTIWLFAEHLKNLGLERSLFDRFNEELDHQGFQAKSGLIVDGSFVEVPRQRNTKAENEQIKNGEIPETLSANPHVLAQKDTDARWTKKNEVSYFGYKDHDLIDEEYKFIRDYVVTDASVHDSQPYLDVMPAEPAYPDQEAFADSAYVGEKIATGLKARGFLPMICEKGYRNKPLTEQQKQMNKIKSSVRCRVEHVFGAMKVRCRDEVLRSIGMARAKFWIGMRNLVYNYCRLVSLRRPKKVPKVA